MHKLRLRTRSTATASSHSHSNNAEEAGGSSAAPSVFGRSSTSTSISTSGRSSSDVKGKGKEKSNGASNAGAGHHGGGLKASLRGITGSADRKNTKKSVQEASNDKERADSLSASQLRPQLTLPTDNDFRASLILPELTRRFTLLRGKDGSLVPFDKMQAHLRAQRENGRLTETEEEMVMRQYRLQSIYEAAQPHDMGSSSSVGASHTSPSAGGLVSLPEETGSLDNRAASRANMYTPEPMTPSLSSPSLGAAYSPYATSPYATSNSSQMLASPQPLTISSSSTSSPSSTPTPVSTVGFASSSAAEFYAARDAVMRGNGLFGGGGLEREIHTKMHASPSIADIDGSSSNPGTPGKRYRSKRYTTSANSSNKASSDTESQHSLSNDGHSIHQGEGHKNKYMFISAIPPVPKIVKQQEEEYDPYRPRDDDEDQEQEEQTKVQGLGFESVGTGQEKTIPSHLDVPMSKRQIHRISRALQDIETELTRTYDFVNPHDGEHGLNGSIAAQSAGHASPQEREHSYGDEYDYTPSDEEGGYNSSYDYSRNARNNFRHDEDGEERTFYSSISADESNSSEYHHQHSDRAPFVYDDTDEIDPGLSRLPSQYELDSRSASALDPDERALSPGALLNLRDGDHEEQPRIQVNAEGEAHTTEDEERQRHDSILSDGTRLSDSTTISKEAGRTSRSATTSTSTLDVIIDGDEGSYLHQQQYQTYGHSLHPQYNQNNARLSASSELSKPASSPGLPYLQATPPVLSSEFTSAASTAADQSVPGDTGFNAQQSDQKEGDRETCTRMSSSESSGSASIQASTSNHTVSSVATSHVPRSSGMSPSTSMTRLPSNTSITNSTIGHSVLPKHLQEPFSPAHSRNTSTSSSIAYNPPLSPPPQCGLPPLPSSSSGHSLASLGQQSMHSHMPSVESVTLMSPSTSAQDASIRHLAEDRQADRSDTSAQDVAERNGADESVPFPRYTGEMDAAAVLPGEPSHQREDEYQNRPRYGSIQSSSDGSDRGTNRYSNTSTGSSWRGGPGGHTRNLSTSTVDFDLPLTSPTTKGGSRRPMTHIEEDIDEDDLFSSEKQDEERRKAMEYLNTHAPGLEMSDLREIHERLVQSALHEREEDSSSAQGEGEANREAGEEDTEWKQDPPQSTAFTSELFASEGQPTHGDNIAQQGEGFLATNTSDAKLGSPFMEQNGFVDQQGIGQYGPMLATVSEEGEASQTRNSATHPIAAESLPMQSKQSSQSYQLDAGSTHYGTTSPTANVEASSSPIGVTGQVSNTSSPRPIQATNTPPSTLRPRQTRNSNSTPSMLIRHVHQQASEATAALKSPFTDQPNSPDEALWRLANMPARRTLSHRKSAKNLKIGTPQLVSSSANLEHMPTVDTLNRNAPLVNGKNRLENNDFNRSPSTSPEVSRKASVAGLKFKMRFKNRSADGHDEDYVPSSADNSTGSAGLDSPSAIPAGSRHAPKASMDNSPSSGIRQLVAKLRRRKVSNEIPDKLIPDPLVLHSPHWSSPKELHDPLSPGAASLTGQFTRRLGEGPPSVNSNSTYTMADVRPLNLDKSASSDKLSALAITTGGTLSSASEALAVRQVDQQDARASANSLDSMRKLFEAATALGLDADRVNELVGAAGYRQSIQTSQTENPVVRSTVILAPSDDSYFPPVHTLIKSQSSSEISGSAAPSMGRSASGTSASRSRSTRSAQNRNASISSVALSTNGGSRSSKHGESTADGSFNEINASPNRKSVHDRPGTPPPDKKTSHRRQRSDAQAAEVQLPVSQETSISSMNNLPIHQPQSQYATMARRRNMSSQSDDLGMPTPSFARQGKDSRASYMSSKTSGSYDARSIYGLYGDEDEHVPPTPGVPDMNMILASGRIPGSSNGSQRASLLLAPGVSAKRLSTASRNSRIELSEYANGDIAFNIVQSLRRPQGTGDGERGTYYPMDLHRRQNSDNSVEEELNGLVASINASPESDPLKLMIKRHMKEQNKSPTITANAAMETIAHLQALHPAGRQRSASAATQASSARSVFEVYEAADENQVAALIEELTKGLDEGQFNLARNDSFTRAAMKNSPSTRNMESPSRINRQDDPASTPRAGVSVHRTPSKIKRQPPPTL